MISGMPRIVIDDVVFDLTQPSANKNYIVKFWENDDDFLFTVTGDFGEAILVDKTAPNDFSMRFKYVHTTP